MIWTQRNVFCRIGAMTVALLSGSVRGQSEADLDARSAAQAPHRRTEQHKAALSDNLDTDELIDRLGAPDFADRQNATRLLKRRGTAVLSRLRFAYHHADDMEVRLRIEGIVHEIYFRQSLRTNVGWLGIRMDPTYHPERQITPRIPAGQSGIRLAEVTRDGPADQAGLEVGDIIVGIDDEPLRGDTNLSFQQLRRVVQRRGPGEVVKLATLRGSQKLSAKVVLGYAPSQILRSMGQRARYDDAVRKANQRFGVWWRHFVDNLAEPMSFKIERLTADFDFKPGP